MLIQDLKFFEQIDNLDDIQGGSSTPISATSEKPNANAAAKAEGDKSFILTSAEDNGVSVSTVLSDLNGTSGVTLEEFLLDAGITDFINVTFV